MRRLFSHWQAKIGSILLAVIFYANLQNSKILVKNINIPVDYPKLSSNLFYSKNPQKTYPVRVEGVRDLVNYHSQFMKVLIDPSELVVGENSIEVKKIWGVPSSGVKVSGLGGTINVGVDILSSKTLPVDIGFDEDPNSNFVRSSYFIKPSRVTIAGPKSLLEKMTKYQLPTVSLRDVSESFTKTIRAPELLKGLSYMTPVKEFQVRVNIIKDLSNVGEQVVVQLPVKCEHLDSNLEADLSAEEVAIKFFSTSQVNSIQIIQGMKATVPCNYTYDKKLRKILPNSAPFLAKVRIVKSNDLKNIEILNVSPERVSIQYKVKNNLKDAALEPEKEEKPDSFEEKIPEPYPIPPEDMR